MSNLVFVTGDFCSGSTLLFTLFRKSEEYYCLYEPLHEKLPEYLRWRLQPSEHHFFVDNYFDEYRGFRAVSALHRGDWGLRNFSLGPDDRDDALYRYLSYLTGAAFGRAPQVLLKENRFAFRSGWLRAAFPQAKIVHIWRDPEEQWKSIVSRGQTYVGREDIGQSAVNFNGFNVATWCDDLQRRFPELRTDRSQTGYERFSKLWALSKNEGQRYADVSVNYRALVKDFPVVFEQVRACVGLRTPAAALQQYVVPPEKKGAYVVADSRRHRLARIVDRMGLRQARVRLRLEEALRARGARPSGA